jgi:hypothetical protein
MGLLSYLALKNNPGIVGGIKDAATGGDDKMDLQDFLKMAALGANIATGNVPAVAAMGTSYLGDATGSEALKTVGDVGGVVAGGVGAANSIDAAGEMANTVAQEAASAGSQIANAGAEGAAITSGLGADMAGYAADAAANASPQIAGTPYINPMAGPGTAAAGVAPTTTAQDPDLISKESVEALQTIGEGLANQPEQAPLTPGPMGQADPQAMMQFLSSMPGDLKNFLQIASGAAPSPYATMYSQNRYGG